MESLRTAFSTIISSPAPPMHRSGGPAAIRGGLAAPAVVAFAFLLQSEKTFEFRRESAGFQK